MTELSDLLTRLEEHWRQVDAPVAKSARPGLSEGEIDRLTAEIDILLPTEARTWFQWHDGSGDGVDQSATIGPRFQLWSLSLLVDEYRYERKNAQAWYEDPENVEIGWPKAWFPVINTGSMRSLVVVDCSVAVGEPAGVGLVCKGHNVPVGTVPSLTELVRYWVSCHDAGLYNWDPAAQSWKAEPGPPGTSPYGNFYS